MSSSNLTRISRRAAIAGLAVMATPAGAQSQVLVEMHRTTGCSCCLVWAKRLEAAGFRVTVKEADMSELTRMKLDAGLVSDQMSCHTAKVAGYTIEGHVPPREIKRLLSERPDAAGLTVPGMPTGSPGMESGSKQEAYDVLLFRKAGPTSVFASYPSKP